MAELIDTQTGEVIDATSVDSLLAWYMNAELRSKQLWALMNDVRRRLGDLTTGDTKTRRLRGAKYSCVVHLPDTSFDQSILREVWNSYPHLRDEFLRIGSLDVRRREFAKLKSTAGTPEIETVRNMLVDAERQPTAPPRITVEYSESEPVEEF